jgi:hypothetical protein
VAKQFTDRIFRAAGGEIDTECACCIVCRNTNPAEISTTNYFGYKNKRSILSGKYINKKIDVKM